MEDLGELIGTLIIILFAIEASRFVLRLIFKYYGRWIKKNTSFHPVLLKVMAYNRQAHPLGGYLIVVLILVHAFIQTGGFAFLSNTGVIAAVLMTTEVAIGLIGTYLMKKPRPKYWIWLHRLVPVATLVAILIHIN